jgi:hypothetical protein
MKQVFELCPMKQVFELSQEDLDKIKSWIKTLPKGYYGCIGGRFTYSFTPTTLGLITVVSDGMTGEEININDFEDW